MAGRGLKRLQKGSVRRARVTRRAVRKGGLPRAARVVRPQTPLQGRASRNRTLRRRVRTVRRRVRRATRR